MWPKKLLRRLQLWIMSRKEYRQIILRQNQIIEERVRDWTSKIEELEQDKLYAIFVDTVDDAEYLNACFNEVSKRLKWSPPLIVILVLKKDRLWKIDRRVKS